MKGIHVRWAVREDAPGVAEVHIASWRAAYRGLIDQGVLDALDVEAGSAGWERWISASLSGRPTDGDDVSHRMLVAESDGRVVAWASFGAGRDSGMTDLGELAGIYAHPDAWSQGVGHALLVRVEDALLASGWSVAYLWVLAGNDRAIAFYEQHDWNSDGQEKYGDVGAARQLHELRHVRQLG